MATTLTRDYEDIVTKTVNTNFTLALQGRYNSQNIANNTSSVSLRLQLRVKTSGRYATWSNGSSTINGTHSTDMPYNGIGNGYPTTQTLNTYTYTVKHSSDGTYKNKDVEGSFSTTYSPMKGTVEGSINLPQIPRTSTISSSSGYVGEVIPISISRKYSSFTDTIRYSFEGTSGTIVSKTSNTSINWTVPTSFYDLLINKQSDTLTLYVDTYSGNSLIGTNSTKVTISVNPNTNRPEITYNVVETNAKAIALNGTSFSVPILNVSQPKFTITATPQNKATISSYSVSVRNGVTGTTNPYTFTNIPSAYFTIGATDSRGVSNNVILDRINVAIPYIVPTIKTITIERESPISGVIKMSGSGTWFGGNFNETTTNTFKLIYRYRDASTSDWSEWYEIPSSNYTLDAQKGTWSMNDYNAGNLTDYRNNYTFQLALLDLIYDDYSIVTTQEVLKGIPTYSAGEHDLSINGQIRKYDINGRNRILIDFPIGCIHITSTNENPKETLGGEWELVDKEFKAIFERSSSKYTQLESNASSVDMVFARSGHTIQLSGDFHNKTILNDSNYDLITFKFNEIGISKLAAPVRLLGFSDGANAIVMLYIPDDTGKMRSIDTLNNKVAVNSAIDLSFVATVPYQNMLDSACDKFYWKRIA